MATKPKQTKKTTATRTARSTSAAQNAAKAQEVSQPENETSGVAKAETEVKPATKAKPATGAKATAEAKPATGAKATAEAKPATKAKATAEAKPATKAKAATEVKAATGAKAATEAKATAEVKAATKAKTETAAKTRTSSKAKPKAATTAKPEIEEKAEAESKAVANVEAAAKPKAAAEPKAAAKPKETSKPEAAAKPKETAEPEAAEPKDASSAAKVEEAKTAQADDSAIAEPAVGGEPVDQPQAETSVQPDYSYVGGVLIAAAECAPLVKVGGLADVVGALPKYLKKLGIDARIIMPFHRQIKERYFTQVQHLCNFEARLGWRSQYVGVEKLELDGTIYYFIDNEFYFGGPVYCGGEFEGEQYAFFTRAVMDALPQLDFDVRVLHCNDWHTAMMPLLVKTQYQGGMQSGLRTVLTIHNLHFQGQFSHEFDRDLLGVDDSLATPQFVEHYGCDNMLKAGIVFADKVNTVSPTYAQEICGPDLGESLEGVLRSRGGDLWGILNGIDTDVWNPADDQALPVTYTAESLERKTQVRDAVLNELGLEPAGPDTAVIGMVGRLTPQKGIDLVTCVLDDILSEDVRVIMLGSGDDQFEWFFRDAEQRHKRRLCSYIGYNGELSHRIYAGSDLFLMPSLFEPCGISQMIAMRYGTLPIVRETGGLRDTVMPYNEFTGEGNGFSFANYNAHEMLGVIRYALGVWRDQSARKRLITQAMASDFSFDRCARTYAELYKSL